MKGHFTKTMLQHVMQCTQKVQNAQHCDTNANNKINTQHNRYTGTNYKYTYTLLLYSTLGHLLFKTYFIN